MTGALAIAVVAGLATSGCVFYLNPQCTDQIHNGDETDVDCGGDCPRVCNIGDSCRENEDCDESTCNSGTCTALPCANGLRDGEETDVDCGGGICSRKCSGARSCEVSSDCASGICLPDGTCSSLRTLSFADAVSYPSGEKTYVLFSADVNRDGRIDLVAANEQGNSLSVFANTGNGIFQMVGSPFPTGAYPTGGALADFDRDGILDVATADYHGHSVSVLFGTGTGALGAKTTYPTIDRGETSNLAVGDLNGDGNLDIVAANPPRASISLLLGQAGGTFAPAVDVPLGPEDGTRPYSPAVGDFDGNGTLDVAVGDLVNGPLIVKFGNGDGTLATDEVLYSTGGIGPYIIMSHDINLDGRLDLVCANRGSSSVSVLIGRADGSFRRAIVSPTGADTGPYALAVADFNLDGVPDVATPNYLSSTGTVLLGIGDGSFEAPFNAGTTGSVSYGVAAGDFNGDGKPDFATANAGTNDVTVKLSTSR